MGGGHVEVERLFQVLGSRVEEGERHGATEVVDHDVEATEALLRPPCQ